MMAVNLRAPFFLIQDAAKIMRREKIEGSIVNIQSMSAHGGQPFISAYWVRRARLPTLTKNAAYSLMPWRIRVNGLNIGWMATPGEDAIVRKYHGGQDGWLEKAAAEQPFGRLIDPKEVARAVAYLGVGGQRHDDRHEYRLRPVRRRGLRQRPHPITRPEAPRWREPLLDVITIGRSSVDLYGQQIGGAARGHGELRQIGRRLPRQHRHRHRAARPASRPDHPRRRRAHGPLHPRAAARARASTSTGVSTDPRAADRAGAPRRSRTRRPSR